jgi:carbamoyltransferase
MRILGISAFYHDSAAALIDDGRIVAAAQEERFTRRKHDAAFPHHAIAYCLGEAGVAADEVDHVVFYDKPFLKFERLLETYVALAPRGFRSFQMSIPLWLKEKLFQKSLLRDELEKFSGNFDVSRLLFCEHHLSHAASAFYPSPYESAAVLTMDGVGEWATTSAAMGNGKTLEIFQEIHFPHSLGLLYSAATYYTGFKVNSGEYKVMGLAPYGEPRFAKLILDHLIDLKPDGSFRLDMSYFDYCTGFTMTNDRFAKLFGEPVRSPDQSLPRRRRGAELRRQRQDFARWPLRQHLDPAGGGRCRRRRGRGAGGLPYLQAATARSQQQRRHVRGLSGSELRPGRDRTAHGGGRRKIRRAP